MKELQTALQSIYDIIAKMPPTNQMSSDERRKLNALCDAYNAIRIILEP